MKNNETYNNEAYERVEAYLLRKMSKTERIIFEAEMEKDEALRKQMEEQEMDIKVLEVLMEKDLRKKLKRWQRDASEETSPEMEVLMEGLEPKAEKPNNNKPSTIGYWLRGGIAASLCLGLLGLGYGVYALNKKVTGLALVNTELKEQLRSELGAEMGFAINDNIRTSLPIAIEASGIQEKLKTEISTDLETVLSEEVETMVNSGVASATVAEVAKMKTAVTEVKEELRAELRMDIDAKFKTNSDRVIRNIADAFMDGDDLAIRDSRSPSEDKLLKESLDALEQKQYDIGISKLTSYIVSKPNNLDARYYLGIAHYQQESFEAAIPHLKFVANKVHFHTKRMQWLLSLSYLKTGKLDPAKSLLQKIMAYEHHPYKEKTSEVLEALKKTGF